MKDVTQDEWYDFLVRALLNPPSGNIADFNTSQESGPKQENQENHKVPFRYKNADEKKTKRTWRNRRQAFKTALRKITGNRYRLRRKRKAALQPTTC